MGADILKTDFSSNINMPTVSVKQILEISSGESRKLEFKSPFSWNGKTEEDYCTKHKVIKTILGMTNVRMGGRIIIGIKEEKNPQRYLYVGITPEQIESFLDQDAILAETSAYSSEPLNFSFTFDKLEDGSEYCIISVSEFERYPTMCIKPDKKNLKILEPNAIYSRIAKDKPCTDKITHHEMKEIIEMSADKENKHLQERGYVKEETSSEYFKNQRGDLNYGQ